MSPAERTAPEVRDEVTLPLIRLGVSPVLCLYAAAQGRGWKLEIRHMALFVHLIHGFMFRVSP